MKKTLLFVFLFALIALCSCGQRISETTDNVTEKPASSETTDNVTEKPASSETDQVTEDVTDIPVMPDEYFKFTLLDDGTYEIRARQNAILPDNVVIPSSHDGKPVTAIAREGFFQLRDIETVVIPDTVTNIGNRAFEHCTGLTSVTIGNGVTSIDQEVFCNCSSLTSITIPDSVTYIGIAAFSNCTGLTSITIPDGVTSIGDAAFYGCDSLTTVYYTGTVEQWAATLTYLGNDNLYYAIKVYNYEP
jgi:hypothetical protein